MKKYRAFRHVVLILAVLIAAASLSGCRSKSDEEPMYAIVVKSEGNRYFERIIEGFDEIVKSHGGVTVIKEPSQATAEEQIRIINGLISDNVKCIAIAVNSESATAPALSRAIKQGIKVISFDSAAEPESRALHVNQADVRLIAKTLMDAAADITGGSGQIAIMSTTNQASNQNAWISNMRGLIETGVYQGLMLVSIVYGEDDYQVTYERTQYLIDNYPELSLIIAPTAAGIPAVAECIVNNGFKDSIKVTGLGMPSQMAEFIGDDSVCPYMFLWDLDEVGKLTAYAAIALAQGTIGGHEGEILSAGETGKYHITGDAFGGSEISLQSEPVRFDESNIDYWKDIY